MTTTTKSFDAHVSEKGTVEAVLATLGVADREGDLTAKSAIPPDGAPVILSNWGHSSVLDPSAAPVGMGRVFVSGSEIQFSGRYFLDTPRGAEAHAVTRNMGSNMQWSWVFKILDEMTGNIPREMRAQGVRRLLLRLDPIEASPVWRAAGVGTRTIAVRAAAPDPALVPQWAAAIARYEQHRDDQAALIRSQIPAIAARWGFAA